MTIVHCAVGVCFCLAAVLLPQTSVAHLTPAVVNLANQNRTHPLANASDAGAQTQSLTVQQHEYNSTEEEILVEKEQEGLLSSPYIPIEQRENREKYDLLSPVAPGSSRNHDHLNSEDEENYEESHENDEDDDVDGRTGEASAYYFEPIHVSREYLAPDAQDAHEQTVADDDYADDDEIDTDGDAFGATFDGEEDFSPPT